MAESDRPAAGSRRVSPLVAGVVVAALAALVLTLTQHEPTAPVSPRQAVSAALHAPHVAQMLAGSHWNRTIAGPIDPHLEQVNFYAGDRIIAAVALDAGHAETQAINFRQMVVPYGDWLAYQPAVLAVLSALFVLMAAVSPWRRLRNLDVVAALSLLLSVLLFQHRYVEESVLAAVPGLTYMLLRCAGKALGRRREPAPSTPLLTVISPGVDPGRRVRWLRVLFVVLALVFLMIGVSSFDAVDVLYAVMEGATKLVHGVLPYGHMPPGIIHGDTYPILSYLLYAPIALFAPVTDVWGSVDAGLALAVVAAVVGAWAVFRITAAARPRARAPRPVEAEEAGLRAALAWLTFPPLLITVSTGTTDVVLAAMLLLAVLLWRRPPACSAMLAIAGWFKLAPFALLAVCLAPLRGRRLTGALVAVGLVTVPLIGALVALGGTHGISDMVQAVGYQFTRGSIQSVWGAVHNATLQPLAQGAVLGLIAAAAVRLRQEPDLARDRARMAALSAAILIGIQLTADYWAFLYLVWVVPLASVSLLADSRGAATQPDGARASLSGAPDAASALAG
jgi:Glycosyltransferase family 87